MFLVLTMFLGLLTACTTPQVTFRSEQEVSLLSKKLGDATDSGTVIKANEAIELATLNGRMVQVSIKNQPLYYWVFYPPESPVLDIKLDQPEVLKSLQQNTPNAAAENRNIIPRLVFMSLRTMDSGDFAGAEKLAEQISLLDATLAMPWLIKAMIFANQGKKSEAVSALERAKALDPSDAEIDKMMVELE